MRPRVFDTSTFILAIRGRLETDTILRPLTVGQGYLSAVVAHELWAGTRNREDADALALLLRGFERLGAVLTPTYQDWILAGRLVEQYQRLYGQIKPAEHANDVLIVLSAAQVRGVVVTANLRHMEHWARLARRSGHQVRVEAVA